MERTGSWTAGFPHRLPGSAPRPGSGPFGLGFLTLSVRTKAAAPSPYVGTSRRAICTRTAPSLFHSTRVRPGAFWTPCFVALRNAVYLPPHRLMDRPVTYQGLAEIRDPTSLAPSLSACLIGKRQSISGLTGFPDKQGSPSLCSRVHQRFITARS